MEEKKATSFNPLDYNRLKEFGLDYIQKIANKNWTDFNAHDPGVTILEALCLGLTDLAYRTNFNIKDLLAKKDESKNSGALFPAEEILSSNPSTIDEYRKLILEHLPFVRNVWITTTKRAVKLPEFSDEREKKFFWPKEINVNGYYDFTIELDHSITIESSDVEEKVRNAVRDLYYQHRNTCEDINEIRILAKDCTLLLDLDLVVANNADINAIVSEIYSKVSDYVSPCPQKYTLEQLLEKGRKPEDIYRGCLPFSTFVDFEELKNLKRRSCIYRSDIIKIIRDIEGVTNVNKLVVWVKTPDSDIRQVNDIVFEDSKELCHYRYRLEKFAYKSSGRILKVDKDNDKDKIEKTYISYKWNGVKYSTDLEIPQENRLEWQIENQPSDQSSFEYPVEQGRYRDTDIYNSFQNLFPTVYRMGKKEKVGLITEEDEAAKLQLKAYLTFFDQFLADYLEQLDSLNKFFSIDNPNSEVLQTYYFKNLTDSEIEGVSRVLKDSFQYRDKYLYHNHSTSQLKEEQKTSDEVIHDDCNGNDEAEKLYYDRRNRLMDHLLARFNETFAEYAAILFVSDYGNAYNYISFLKEGSKDKSYILRNYPSLSANRFGAVYFSKELNLSGLEKKILSRLGIENQKAKIATINKVFETGEREELLDGDKTDITFAEFEKLTDPEKAADIFNSYFGLHIIEHINLIPAKGLTEASFISLTNRGTGDNNVSDPYTFRATVLLPGYLDKDEEEHPEGNLEFRTYVEEVVKEEFPAHVAPIIGWIETPQKMFEAESAYENLVSIMSEPTPHDSNWEDRQYAAIAKYIEILITEEVYHGPTTVIEKELVKNPPVVVEVHPVHKPKPVKYAAVNNRRRKGFTTKALIESLMKPRYIEIDQGYSVNYVEKEVPGYTETVEKTLRINTDSLVKLIEEFSALNDKKKG
ncbi:MAG: hypothetical protein IKP81_07460 [Paludibacteraceae bacterium]|nr:hypothetical protein [Paludibacteraceae bacterium]